MVRKHECHRHVITCGVAVVEYPQGSGSTSTLGYDNPPRKSGSYSYTNGVRLPPGTSTLPGYDYPHTQGGTSTLPGYDYLPVLLPCQGTITRGTSTLPGCDYPHTQGGTSTLPGQDYPRFFYPAKVRLPPIHRGVLSLCQGRITPR